MILQYLLYAVVALVIFLVSYQLGFIVGKVLL